MIVVFFLLSLIVNILVGYYISAQKGNGTGGSIYDVGFHLLPNWEQHEHLPDYLLAVPILFLLYAWPSWSPKRRMTIFYS